jgi:hypothetical protein
MQRFGPKKCRATPVRRLESQEAVQPHAISLQAGVLRFVLGYE